jgi:antitoxin (DNA-binding transcriptional repressor) of toxin-antitoxin stability system
MSKVSYINTYEIRKDLMGFLKSLANGQQYVVLNRSKPVVTLSGKGAKTSQANARQNMKEFLEAAAKIRAQAEANGAKDAIPQGKTYKDVYYEDMAKKYGL